MLATCSIDTDATEIRRPPRLYHLMKKGRSEERPEREPRRRGDKGGYALSRIVHLVFDRMRGVLEANHFGHLQLDVTVDEVVIEHAAGLEEVAILVEATERLAQRAAHRRNLLQFLRRQVVEVLVHRGARIELVLHAIEAGHQHRGKAEIG